MSGMIDFYYEFASPYSYIAAQRLPALAKAAQGVRWRPIELRKVWADQGDCRKIGGRNIVRCRSAWCVA